MRIEEQKAGGTEVQADSFSAVEFELALDMQDPTQSEFEDCVRSAASAIGGELLFDMPADGSIEDASRIAAVRVRSAERQEIIFAILSDDGETIRLADREEIGDRFHGFARAFVGVLTRIREDLPFGQMEAEGTA